MNTTANVLPEVTRPNVGTVMSSEWTVRTPERQLETVEILVDVWSDTSRWPDGLYTYSFYLGTDGSTVLHYSQWRDDQAYRDFFQAGRKPRVERIDAAVPGIERHDLAFYDLHRSVRAAPAGARPEAIVTEFVPAEGPEHARRLAAELAAARERVQPDGLVSAHFHVASDGSRVLDYSEWADEAGARAYLAAAGGRRVKVFRPYRALAAR
ncbi:hypothetical protein [Actinomadura sediminis]|uniref:Antibiotic biosynthesis monooxygenase n=1 Tax=Actinomadura sediminis TaxID=1038904 RepID=A0ABW3ES96_9ACTN